MLTKHESQVEALYARDVQKVYAYKERRGEKPYNTWGFWSNATKSYDEAIANMMREVVERAQIGRTMRVLDVGCGCGVSSLDIHEQSGGATVVGVDLTRVSVDYGQMLVTRAGVGDKVRIERMSATALAFPSASFDRIIAIDCACHFDTRESFIAQSRRVLAPGGKIVMLDLVSGSPRYGWIGRLLEWAMMLLWKIPIGNRYSAAGLRDRLEQNGFETIQIEPVTDRVLPFAIAHMRRPEFRREYARDFGWAGDNFFQLVLWAMERVQRWKIAEFVLVSAVSAARPI